MALRFTQTKFLKKKEKICVSNGSADWLQDTIGLPSDDFLAINSKKKIVTWYSDGGSIVYKKFHCQKTPLNAIFFALNPTESNEKDDLESNGKESQRFDKLKLGVLILLSNLEISLQFYDGESYDLLLPCSVQNIVSTTRGLIFQGRTENFINKDSVSCFFSLSSPFSPFKPLNFPPK